jgi:hypothetical protein
MPGLLTNLNTTGPTECTHQIIKKKGGSERLQLYTKGMHAIFKRSRKARSLRDPEDLAEGSDSDDGTGISPPLSADALLKPVPALKNRLFSVLLERADCSGKWHPRRAILTKESIILCRDDHNYISDEIPLKLIEAISIVHHSGEQRTAPNVKTSSIRLDQIDFRTESAQNDGVGQVVARREQVRESSNMTTSFRKVIATEGSVIFSGFPFYVFVKAGETGSSVRYQLRTQLEKDREDFLAALLQERDRRILHGQGTTCLSRLQLHLARLYQRYAVSGAMAALIVASFAVDITEAELRPQRGSPVAVALSTLDMAFTAAFALDLLVNIAAHGLRELVCRGEENQQI